MSVLRINELRVGMHPFPDAQASPRPRREQVHLVRLHLHRLWLHPLPHRQTREVMIFGINNDWFSPKRNLERIGYCFSYIRKHGWERFCTHMYVDLFPVRKCSSRTMLFRGVYSLDPHNPAPFTFKVAKVFRLLNKATSIDIVIMYASGGGAVSYLWRLMKDQSKDCLTFVIRSAETTGITATETYWHGKIAARFLSRGLSTFNGLPPEKCRTIWINDLVYWNWYAGVPTMNPRALHQVCDEVIALKNTLKMQMTYLMHDFYHLCPRWTFVNERDEYCGDDPTQCDCNRCLSGAISKAQPYLFEPGTDITEWRNAGIKIMRASNEGRCFSNDTKRHVLHWCPDLTNLTVVPHKPISNYRSANIRKSQIPTVGVFGAICIQKGLGQVLELSAHLTQINSPVKIIIVGSMDDCPNPPPNITVTGPYERTDLPRIVEEHGINVAFFSSICPETFSYVTQELIMLRLPIVCFNIGAQAERVSKYEYGRIAKSMRAEDVWAAIQEAHAHFMKATA